MIDPMTGVEKDLSGLDAKEKAKAISRMEREKKLTEEERAALMEQRRKFHEAETSTEELIRRMERNADIVMRMYPRDKARGLIEQMLETAQISGQWHSGFPEACLAMAARLDHLLSK
jgi:hypothetical protein